MLPVAKALVITVLLGGGAVGTCALAGGFGPGGSGSGNEETTTQVAATEASEPTVSERSTSEDATLASSSSSSTLADGSREEGVSDSSPNAKSGSEDKETGTSDGSTGKENEKVLVAQRENTEGNSSPEQTEEHQEATGSRGTDGQVLPAARPEQEDTQTKTAKGSDEEQGNAEQSAGAAGKSQDVSTDESNPNTVTKNQESGSNNEKGEVIEETRTASGETVQQGQEPEAGAN